MDRVVNLVTQVEINQDERDYLRRRVEVLDGIVDRGKHLQYSARTVSERALREVTLHHHNCPYNDSIFLAARAGTVWHCRRDCHPIRTIPDQHLQEWRLCMNCACGVLPPFVRERGETLHEVLSELYVFAGDPDVQTRTQPAPEPEDY